MLEVQDLNVEVAGKEILHDINFCVGENETLVLFGPNGSGKTTLLMTVMGLPRYRVTKGRILFKGQDITYLPVNERARLGIGLSFQRPPVVQGVKTRDMLRVCLKGENNDRIITELAARLNLNEFLDRDVNSGFSGGEIKRSELLQLMAQSPNLTLLDEPESGVDLVNISLIGKMINELLQKDSGDGRGRERSGLIVTHTGHILDYAKADRAYVIVDGTMGCEGIPEELLNYIREAGYRECAASCQKHMLKESL